MSNIDELLSKKTKYENLKDKVLLVIDEMEKAIENLEVPVDNIPILYNIDDESADKGKLSYVKSSLNTQKNYLKNTIIPEIQKNISELGTNIETAYELEEEKKQEEKMQSVQKTAVSKPSNHTSNLNKTNTSTSTSGKGGSNYNDYRYKRLM